MKIDDSLLGWSAASIQGQFGALLLGNGFSINKHSDFGYSSLYQKAVVAGRMGGSAQALFTRRGSSNFEEVLQLLDDAGHVDRLLGPAHTAAIGGLVQEVRAALLSTVRGVHVLHGALGTSRLLAIAGSLRDFKSVFTTNYDLIPYWSLNERSRDDFYDYFWGTGFSFDPDDTEVFPARTDHTALYYLHGGLHLVQHGGGVAQKLVSVPGASVIDLSHWAPYADGARPLFITEGTAAEKMRSIYASAYLRFAYQRFELQQSDVVVLGHALHPRADAHLVDAIASWPRATIAVGVWTGMGSQGIIEIKNRLMGLGRHNWIFFDFDTHPLAKA